MMTRQDHQMHGRMSFAELGAFYRQLLLDDIIPFWERQVDAEHGGLLNCLRDDASLASDDKYIWSQARALWVFSKLYNTVEPRPEWLAIATGLYRFLAAHGRDAQGYWVWRTNRRGDVLDGPQSIYADGFALYGLAEYFRATGDEEARRIGLETYHRVVERLAVPGSYPLAPYEVPQGMKCHGVSMIFSLVFWEFGRAIGDPTIVDDGYCHTLEVLNHYRRPEHQALLEYIGLDNRPVDSPPGRCIVPGHAIESMWMQMHVLLSRGETARIPAAVECMRWHLERGWDPEYGGIFLGLDLRGVEPPYWGHPTVKTWWQHTEALYATLLAYEQTGEAWCLDWYWRVHDWTFAHYPDPVHGEWRQRLDRQGRPITEVVALPVKDPFHLPRALIYLVDVLERLAGNPVHPTCRKDSPCL